MKRAGENGKNSERSDRGASPTVAIVLLFGMVFVGAAAILVSGSALLDGIQDQATDERAEQNFRAVDETLATQAFSGKNMSLVLEPGEAGRYNVSDRGNLSVTVANRFGTSCRIGDMNLGTLEFENGNGDTMAYQAGGIWRQSGGQTVVMSEPDIRYYTDETGDDEVQRLDVSVLNLSGTVGQGEHTARQQSGSDFSGNSCFEKVRFATHVTIEINDTPYHDGWADFLREEFNVSSTPNSVTTDSDTRSVTIKAMLDYQNRPFAAYAGVTPTIYGGLYADGNGLTLDDSVTVDRYNGSAGWDATANVTEDLLVVNDSLDLESGASVTGVPVANGQLTGDSGATVSSIAFATDPKGDLIDETNGTKVYNVTGTDPPEVFGAKMSESFDGIDSIDDDVTQSIDNLDNFDNATTIPGDSTLDVPSGEVEQLYYDDGNVDAGDIDEIDTDDGYVHVAVDGDLDLKNVDVTGDGQAYFYVSGDVTVDDVTVKVDDVTVKDERASGLWIYGTSSSDVNVKDEFQGVVYAPESDLTIENNATVYGALVGGETTIGDNATVHFDKTLRTDIPIPEANRDVAIDYVETRLPVDVTFVLDKSGSMGECRHFIGERCNGNDPHGLRVDATKDFIGELNDSDRAGAVEFDTSADVLHELDSDFDAVNQSLEANAGGGTDMSVGVEKARGLYDSESESNESIMILLTDGENDVNCWRCDPDEETLDEAEEADAENITIYTIGLGNEAAEGLLEDVANEADGEYYHVSDAEDLNHIFEDIASNVTATTTTTFEVSDFHEPSESPDRHVIDVREWPVEIDD